MIYLSYSCDTRVTPERRERLKQLLTDTLTEYPNWSGSKEVYIWYLKTFSDHLDILFLSLYNFPIHWNLREDFVQKSGQWGKNKVDLDWKRKYKMYNISLSSHFLIKRCEKMTWNDIKNALHGTFTLKLLHLYQSQSLLRASLICRASGRWKMPRILTYAI